MNNYILTQINIYPIKSLGGISLTSSFAFEKGLKYDRRWMLIDSNNRFISQREYAQLALIKAEICENEFEVFYVETPLHKFQFPLQIQEGLKIIARVWDDEIEVIHFSNEADEWFSAMIGFDCKLVFMPENALRLVDTDYAKNKETVSLADGYPFLIIGEESLNELNSKLENSILMNRFRPNFIFSGGYSFDEDSFGLINIGSAEFIGIKPCARCNVTTINQENATKSKEPLKTLSTFRNRDNKILFGQNLILKKEGVVSIGDSVNLVSIK
jgi:uncharacterized protein YcbX